MPSGRDWPTLEGLFRKRVQKNATRVAPLKMQWFSLEDDTLTYYEAGPSTKERPPEPSRVLGAYNVVQLADCTLHPAAAVARSPMALRGFTLRLVGGKIVSLVPVSRRVDPAKWVAEINARRGHVRLQQAETHELVEKGIEKITRITAMKDELGLLAGDEDLPLDYSNILVDADLGTGRGGGGGSSGEDSDEYDWEDKDDDAGGGGGRGAARLDDEGDEEPRRPPTPKGGFARASGRRGDGKVAATHQRTPEAEAAAAAE
jgi:hypothetical protein